MFGFFKRRTADAVAPAQQAHLVLFPRFTYVTGSLTCTCGKKSRISQWNPRVISCHCGRVWATATLLPCRPATLFDHAETEKERKGSDWYDHLPAGVTVHVDQDPAEETVTPGQDPESARPA